MSETTTPKEFHLFRNRIDNTLVIVKNSLVDAFVDGLSEIGYPPELLESSDILTELQFSILLSTAITHLEEGTIPQRRPQHMGTGIHVDHQFSPKELVFGDTFFDADFGDMIWNGKKWIQQDVDRPSGD